jgi:hypothetical protein
VAKGRKVNGDEDEDEDEDEGIGLMDFIYIKTMKPLIIT